MGFRSIDSRGVVEKIGDAREILLGEWIDRRVGGEWLQIEAVANSLLEINAEAVVADMHDAVRRLEVEHQR